MKYNVVIQLRNDFLEFKTWKTPTWGIKELNIKRGLFIVIDEMTNILDHFGRKLGQEKENSSNWISKLEDYLTTAL